MALTAILEQLLRVQAAAGQARVQLAAMSGIPGAERIAQEIVRLETELASTIARGIGAIPMAQGGLVTQPTFALIGEAGPEMVVPVKKKRKVSKYNRELGRQIKALKVKHPRTPVPKLMKKAHLMTKRKLKMTKR